MDAKIVGDVQLRTKLCTTASATVIEAGDLVAMNSGLIIKATATSAAVGYAPKGCADGETQVEVSVGNDFLLKMDAEEDFEVAQKGVAYDIDVDGATGKQTLNQSGTTYEVLRVDISENAGTVDSKEDVLVRIEEPIF